MYHVKIYNDAEFTFGSRGGKSWSKRHNKWQARWIGISDYEDLFFWTLKAKTKKNAISEARRIARENGLKISCIRHEINDLPF